MGMELDNDSNEKDIEEPMHISQESKEVKSENGISSKATHSDGIIIDVEEDDGFYE